MQKRIHEAAKQETVMVEEIERIAYKFDKGNVSKQPQFKWAALKRCSNINYKCFFFEILCTRSALFS